MATEGSFTTATNIYVATASKLSFEQIRSVTNELLQILGYPDSYTGFTFHFIDDGHLIQANASVDHMLRISIGN
ncbi:hypothetical protein [Mucilaginibacter gotjawali]|uniref:Uncharacterized protein n=1 Tax=Mucilaginibacter gotjawali TaxID=1550579 RepID=A0A839SJV0_9SPHI|nr:hypothetical protein [Mucilaginibacter gotjawali]MBB3057150.1 hypothetical protein [Mucilaginibacter gotjawali]